MTLAQLRRAYRALAGCYLVAGAGCAYVAASDMDGWFAVLAAMNIGYAAYMIRKGWRST